MIKSEAKTTLRHARCEDEEVISELGLPASVFNGGWEVIRLITLFGFSIHRGKLHGPCHAAQVNTIA